MSFICTYIFIDVKDIAPEKWDGTTKKGHFPYNICMYFDIGPPSPSFDTCYERRSFFMTGVVSVYFEVTTVHLLRQMRN